MVTNLNAYKNYTCVGRRFSLLWQCFFFVTVAGTTNTSDVSTLSLPSSAAPASSDVS